MSAPVVDEPGPAADADGGPEQELRQLWEQTRPEVLQLWDGFQFHIALERTMAFVTATNAYIEKRAPWKLGKSTEPADQAMLRTSLATMAEALRLGSTLLQPFMPGVAEKIHGVLGYVPGADWQQELIWGAGLRGSKVAESLVLFPRIQPAEKPIAKP